MTGLWLILILLQCFLRVPCILSGIEMWLSESAGRFSSKQILLELDRVLVNIDDELTIPKPRHYDIIILNNYLVLRMSILTIYDAHEFALRRVEIRQSLNFLLWLFQVQGPNHEDWFENYLTMEGIWVNEKSKIMARE